MALKLFNGTLTQLKAEYNRSSLVLLILSTQAEHAENGLNNGKYTNTSDSDAIRHNPFSSEDLKDSQQHLNDQKISTQPYNKQK